VTLRDGVSTLPKFEFSQRRVIERIPHETLARADFGNSCDRDLRTARLAECDRAIEGDDR
jgi:hypothetical protein